MKKLEYKTPAIEVIEIEVEGMIAASGTLMQSSKAPTSEPSSTNGSSISSYSMDNYSWK
ncbi:MAG: hypothetical protein R3Y22_06725 [Bacteroidales bacterium]